MQLCHSYCGAIANYDAAYVHSGQQAYSTELQVMSVIAQQLRDWILAQCPQDQHISVWFGESIWKLQGNKGIKCFTITGT